MPTPPTLMGILNLTPDSFYDGGTLKTESHLLQQASKMIEAGAHWLDIGGESTRPGAEPISEQEELNRVIPAIEALRRHFDIPLSIDTHKAVVMQEALGAGAALINDIWALRGPDSIKVATNHPKALICLMHMQGTPQTMQENPTYNEDVIQTIKDFFVNQIKVCENAGIERNRLILDPGIGFGKTLKQNISIINRLEEFNALGLPLLIGVSRKSMIGQILDKPVNDRLFGSVSATLEAVSHGASWVRTHDVGATKDALQVMLAIRNQ